MYGYDREKSHVNHFWELKGYDVVTGWNNKPLKQASLPLILIMIAELKNVVSFIDICV